MISIADISKPKTADMPYFVIQISIKLWSTCIKNGKLLLLYQRRKSQIDLPHFLFVHLLIPYDL